MSATTTPAAATSAEFARTAALGVGALEDLMVRGETPSVDALVGWEWRGQNLGPIAPFTPFQKFIKGFYRAASGEASGFNIPVVQDGPGRPWTARPSDDAPRRFGFFRVDRVDPASRDNAYLHALLLDYGRGKNPLLDVTKGLRDYVVRVEPGKDDLLLGKAYYALGPARVPVGWFLLERRRPSTFVR
ncbi:MAG: hypothetical protein M9894_13225 [Planctomycetes bacterium]|nr:hypothetical protein [Planctomycetota bacterium]